MSLKDNLNKLMQQAQLMQEKMQRAQEELINLRITGQAGAGLVKIVMNGRHEAVKVELDDEVMEEEKEVLEDLLTAAFNDAHKKIEEASRGKIADLASNLQMPKDFGDIFGSDEDTN